MGEWHDLRKDPDDFPTPGIRCRVTVEYSPENRRSCICSWSREARGWLIPDSAGVIAWKDLEVFKE